MTQFDRPTKTYLSRSRSRTPQPRDSRTHFCGPLSSSAFDLWSFSAVSSAAALVPSTPPPSPPRKCNASVMIADDAFEGRERTEPRHPAWMNSWKKPRNPTEIRSNSLWAHIHCTRMTWTACDFSTKKKRPLPLLCSAIFTGYNLAPSSTTGNQSTDMIRRQD